MMIGLHVEDEHGVGAAAVCKIGWNTPPPTGAHWSCCRRSDVPRARVSGVEWAGLDPDPAVWVKLEADAILIGHLVDKHGFVPLDR
jgi:hypothetical protein